MIQTSKSRLIHDYLHRLKSAVEDGYLLSHSTETASFYCASLVHRANGNRIVLFADFGKMTLSQKTNHLLTYLGTYDMK